MRTITALYDSREDAEAARARLEATGVERSAIQITAQDAQGGSSAEPTHERGFFSGLKDFFMPDEDRHAYSEGIRRGGQLLTATVPEERADTICQILDQTGAVDFDQRQAQWRSEGWQGSSSRTDQSEETIPVAEERLRVGKREVERGGVRVRSYVEEHPVEQQVDLRQEHVEVERRPVDQQVSGENADNLFQERTIEMSEHGEEAVVGKEAIVREEIGIRKDVDQRTETVRDSVRETKVDVQDERSQGGMGSSGREISGEPASFRSEGDDHSIAMDGEDGTRINETEEERRQRLSDQGGTERPRF